MKIVKQLVKQLVLCLSLVGCVEAAEQNLPFYCPFDYPTGQLYTVASGVWDAGGSAGPELTVSESAALTAPPGLVSSTGKGVLWAPSGTARRNAMQFSAVGSGNATNLYVSFLLRIITPPSSGAKLFAYVEASASSTTTPQLGIFVDAQGRVGIGKKSSSAVVWSSPLGSDVHFIVVRYTFIPGGNDEVALWVDPSANTFEMPQAPSPNGSTAGGSDPTSLSYFVINCPSGAGPQMHIDEIRIGLHWADVTPSSGIVVPPSDRPVISVSSASPGRFKMFINGLQPGKAFRLRSSGDLHLPISLWEPGIWQTAVHEGVELEMVLDNTNMTRFFVAEISSTNPTCLPPVILSHPQSLGVMNGQEARFAVVATGDGVSFQWYRDNSAIIGATSSTLVIPSVDESHVGQYYVAVWNDCGSVTSQTARLSIMQPPTDGRYYVAPNGSDSNPGSAELPFYSVSRAVAGAAPGDTIYVRGGTYYYTQTIVIDRAGTSNNWIKLFAYPGERPIFNFSNQPYGASNRGILITTNAKYWHIKGIEICYAGDNGMKVEGSFISIEQCVFHHNRDTGLQIGFSHDFVNPDGMLAAFIEVINCDSYMNYDPDNRGSDADGFAAKMHCGKGIVFIGCRAWKNSDDGWDLFETDASVIISNCWTWHNGDASLYNVVGGSFQGNGNGFKLGGNGAGGNSRGTHYVYNCVAFNNNFPGRTRHGFDQNSHKDGIVMYNCLAWNNLYNYFFEEAPNPGKPMIFKNNVSFGGTANATGVTTFPTGTIQENNTWNLGITASAADYVILTEEAAEAPREPDGSLPSGFARLVWGSSLIDRGVDVGIPWCGNAPDLGPYELCQ